jgi:hypothetical protein
MDQRTSAREGGVELRVDKNVRVSDGNIRMFEQENAEKRRENVKKPIEKVWPAPNSLVQGIVP